VEARTGLVMGGITAVAASVAVVTAVAFANTAALADSPGTNVETEHVVVPAAAAPSATPTAASDAQPPQAEAEVAEAPAPEVAPTESTGSQTPGTSVAPVAPAPPVPEVARPAAPAVPGDIEAAIAAAKEAGSWEAVRAWAIAHGWSSERIDALVSHLQRELEESPVREHKPSGRESTGWQRPGHGAPNVGHGDGAVNDGKKDQSRNSPDWRD